MTTSEDADFATAIGREEISITTEDGEAALQIRDTKIVLRTFFEELEHDRAVFGEHVDLNVEVDSDGDNGAWWNLYNDDEPFLISIQPELVE